MKICLWLVLSLVALALAAGLWLLWVLYTPRILTPTNPHNYSTIGSIPVPRGYERILPEDGMAQHFRELPLKPRGAQVKYQDTDRDVTRYKSLAYAVIDLPLLRPNEDCADVCLHLRADYFFKHQQYNRIHFNGQYSGGSSEKAYRQYMRKAMADISTYQLAARLPKRALEDIRPGDIFVYPAGKGHSMGHAITVVDVAVNKRTGKKIFMLAEGNYPGRSIHLMRNFWGISTPWFSFEDGRLVKYGAHTFGRLTGIPFFQRYTPSTILLTVMAYQPDDLRYFK